MQTREETTNHNPLRDLTPAQFMALGGNAVVYVKPIRGDKLAELMSEPQFDVEEDFHLVVSADGCCTRARSISRFLPPLAGEGARRADEG
jgi:hypothetical protein